MTAEEAKLGLKSFTHECPPFAIINPIDKIEVQNERGEKEVRYGRQYAWGFCDAFSPKNSDFNRLYKLITSKSCVAITVLYRYPVELVSGCN